MNHTPIVLFGGPSDERHVSVASAQNIVRALGRPLAWFWAPEGAVHDVGIDDLLAHERAADALYFLELNTPGLTSASLVPQELREAGIPFREFLERQMALAGRRGSPGHRFTGTQPSARPAEPL